MARLSIREEFQMLRILSLLALGVLLASQPVLAKKPVEKVVAADTPEKFDATIEKIRGQMAEGQRYEFLKEKDRETVNRKLDRMREMLVEAGSVEAMQPEQKVKLFSIQEEVNGILARNADDRLVCSHDAPTGSHLPMTSCHTVRELVHNRENARHQMDVIKDQNRQGITNSRD